MIIQSTPLSGLVVVTNTAHSDGRGTFSRLYCQRELKEILGSREIVQINRSTTTALGALRGLHYQSPPFAEMKLVRCLRGRVWDVAVDIRRKSPTFLRWHGVELTEGNGRMVVIPEGFAHGFQLLAPNSELLYLHTEAYNADAEAGLRYNDPALGISWPLPVTDISERDQRAHLINLEFQGIAV